MLRFHVCWAILAALLLASLAGCRAAPDDRVPVALVPMIVVARQDPAATVGLFYDLLMQKEYAATAALFTEESVNNITDNGRRSYVEVHRRRAYTQGHVTSYKILAVRYPDPATAHVDIDIDPDSGWPSEHTVFLTKGSQGWQISGGLSRNIVP